MLSDLALAKDEIKQFEQAQLQKQEMSGGQEGGAKPMEFQVQCLTTANWPAYKQLKVAMPPHVQSEFNQFAHWYGNKHITRQLTICFSLGQGVVSFSLPGRARPTDLVVSTLGMFILLLFNERVSLAVTEIVEALQVDEVTVRKNLACLTQQKYKILQIEKRQAEVDAGGDVEMIDT